MRILFFEHDDTKYQWGALKEMDSVPIKGQGLYIAKNYFTVIGVTWFLEVHDNDDTVPEYLRDVETPFVRIIIERDKK